MENRALEHQARADGHHNPRKVEGAHHQHLIAREERAREQRIDGHLRAAAHEGREHNGEAAVALGVHAAGAHHGGHGAAKAHHHGNEAAAVQAQLAQRTVHQEGGARHVTAVLQDGQQQEQNQDRRQEGKHASHARKHAVNEQIMHPSGHAPARQRAGEQVYAVIHKGGKAIRYPCAKRPKGDVEHKQHHHQEHGNGQHRVGQHVIDAVGQGIAFRAAAGVAGGEQLFNKGVAGVRHHGGALHAHLPLHGG